VIENPDSIDEEVVIEFELDNKAQLKPGFPKFVRPDDTPYPRWNSRSMKVASGVYDDPFIFPAFFGTNIVGMAVRIPIELFPEKQALLIWATSHKGRRQVDHVGRSLRTQNPRFELLNTLHPKEHVQAILREHEHPSLMRDIFLRLNFAQTFAYRRWDMVPDVMVFTTQYPVGFPNGRLLTDDVSALLAQYGDTLLYELSYQHNNGDWPRQTTNDGMASREFKKTFPYLLEPAPDGPPPPPLRLTTASILKLLGVFLVLALLFILENWIVAHWYYRYKTRRRYQ
jgi:hypothetical protein